MSVFPAPLAMVVCAAAGIAASTARQNTKVATAGVLLNCNVLFFCIVSSIQKRYCFAIPIAAKKKIRTEPTGIGLSGFLTSWLGGCSPAAARLLALFLALPVGPQPVLSMNLRGIGAGFLFGMQQLKHSSR